MARLKQEGNMRNCKQYCTAAALLILIIILFPLTAFAADIFSTTGEVTPEKDIYYVGDTVEITDYFRNKGTATATNVSVEYYYRLNGSNSVYSGSPIYFGTVSGGSSESHSYQYTFKESDIGSYRIGAKVTYTLSGTVSSEYSSGHDFAVAAAPVATATPTPEPTASPTATATLEATPTAEPTATPEPVPTDTPQPEATPAPSVSEGPTKAPANVPTASSRATPSVGFLDTLLSFSPALLVLMAVLAVLLIALIIAIIIVSGKRKGSRYR